MARTKQETLVLFRDVVEITEDFTDESFGRLMRAAFAYRFSGEIYSGDDLTVNLAFRMIKSQIDRYEKARDALKQNAVQQNAAESRKIPQNAAESRKIPQNAPHTHTHTHTHTPESNPDNTGEDASAPPDPKKFRKPTLAEVSEYVRAQGYAVNPERFVSFYDSNGWKVGKNPMKDWRAAVRSWNSKADEQRKCKSPKAQELDDFYTMAARWAEDDP